MEEVLKLDKSGIDFWSSDGIVALDALGFALAPWQYPPERLGIPIV
jgi:hypothetical protein